MEVAPRGGGLVLDYRLTGATAKLVLPPPAAPTRADELWRRTCFEAFVRTATSEAYFEFNFSPSGAWAAYGFSAYRTGMSPARGLVAPLVEVARTAGSLRLRAWLEPPCDPPWRLGLSAVIEEGNGRKSYWALRHPPGRADFHHLEGFAYELPSADGP